MKQYQLLDSGDSQKLEAFGDILLARPSLQAVWKPRLPKAEWEKANAVFSRGEKNQWKGKQTLPSSWIIQIEGIQFKVAPTDFGHLGVFPEHSYLWNWIRKAIAFKNSPKTLKKFQFLNLFAYSGGASLAAAQTHASVCHLDASKPMVDLARENAELNGLSKAPIRWIVDDAVKFLKREKKRGVQYDGILLDPPTFGRGPKQEVFKIEDEIVPLLELCRDVLSEHPSFVIFSSHTPGFTPLVMQNLTEQMMTAKKGQVTCGEMVISAKSGLVLPSGSYAIWSAHGIS